jgi:cohesin complex subunit SA-1/2
MNLHILFCSSQATAPDGQALPTAPLALQLDEEVQHRCAGFIQASIEQYAELLEDGSAAQEEQNESDHDDSSEEEPAPAVKNPKGTGKSTSKAKAKSPAERSMSQTQ